MCIGNQFADLKSLRISVPTSHAAALRNGQQYVYRATWVMISYSGDALGNLAPSEGDSPENKFQRLVVSGETLGCLAQFRTVEGATSAGLS